MIRIERLCGPKRPALYDPDDGDPDGALKAGEQFPTMIASAVRAVLKKR